MKKGWKITLISLGSLLGLVVVVVAVALWLVFTPSRLTKIVNKLAGEYIACESHFDNVDLTLLSTFPDAGLKVDNVYLVNPTEGAPSDTLARIGSLTVGLDVKAFLKERKVIVHQVLLDDADANLFIARDGSTNFDIFPSSGDTASSSTSLPEEIDIQKVKLSNLNACLLDERDGMNATLEGVDLNLKGYLKENDADADLSLGIPRLAFAMSDTVSGRITLGALLNDLELTAKGSLQNESIKAKASLGGRQVAFNMADSAGRTTLATTLHGLKASLKGDGSSEMASGLLALNLDGGTLNAAGTDMINPALQASKHDLLAANIPFTIDLNKMLLALNEASISLDDYTFTADGDLQLPADSMPLGLDLQVATDGAWQVAPLLSLVPQPFMAWKKGMDLDGKADLTATIQGTLSDSTMPLIDAHLTLANGLYHQPQVLPYKVNKINGDLTAHLDLGKGGISHAVVKSLSARTRDTRLNLSGRADDLLGDMRVDATVKGGLPLADLLPLIPDSLPLTVASGDADLDLHAKFRLSQLQAMNLEKMEASGTLNLRRLDITYDTLRASTPNLDLTLQLPAKRHTGSLADARLRSGDLLVEMPHKGIKAKVEQPNISLGVNNMLKNQLAASFVVLTGDAEATLDSMLVSLHELNLKGSIRLDSTQTNPLKQFNPVASINAHSALLYMPDLPDAVRLSQLSLDYNAKQCDIKKVQVKLGHSDFELYGTVDNLEEWLSDQAMLHADLNFTSNYADVDQILDMVSGMGSDPDSLEAMRKEDKVPSDANPFIVPKNVDLTLHTHIQRSVAFGNDLNDVAGSLTVKDGAVILDQMGFVCKAARMQLTALYRSPRPSNLFAAIDFHLLDIQIDELLDMIPVIDTLVPMLAAFDGNADFHLAGESYLFANYQPKFSSLLGSAAISGQNLVLMDNSSISSIAKLMRFKSWKEKDNKIRVDSLSVEMTCFEKEIEVFPFLLNIGSYSLCASGKHTLDNACNYHIELLKNPLLAKVGVDIKGSLSKPKISLGQVRYADLYRPEKQGAAAKRAIEMKTMIRQALEKNVR
ncbi:MAG: AsmA family protein [Bacteroidales bacterium]|nr:AsmA family protein [Bacteroidales bacterium]